MTLNDEARSEAWNDELYQYSTHSNHWSHCRGRSPVRQCKYMAIILFVALNCPSTCGWNTDVKWSFTPAMVNNSFLKYLMKTGSRSLTMVLRMSCSLMMESKKTCANHRRVRLTERQEVHNLGESIHDGENNQLPLDLGQSLDEVDGDVCPHHGGNIQAA
jgi:hypothetical protein